MNIMMRRLLVISATAATLVAPVALAATPAQAATVACSVSTPTAKLPTIRPGDRGSCVAVAQRALIAHGFGVGPAGADGQYGAGTLAATKRFQASRVLVADGIIGALTWSRLRGSAAPVPSGYNRLKGPNYTSRVIFTYDDCPRSLTSLRSALVSARAHNIGMVLAPTGNCITSFRARYGVDLPALARSHGQYVINHSVTHPHYPRLTYAQVLRELRAPGVVTNFARPPYLEMNATARRAFAAAHILEWDASVDTSDYLGKTTAQLVAYVLRYARAGDTVLMHMGWNGFNPTFLGQAQHGLAVQHRTVCRRYPGVTPVRLPSRLPC